MKTSKHDAVELNGKKLIARELTVEQVADVMESLIDEETHIMEAMAPEIPISAKAVSLSVGVDLDELKGLLPSQVPALFRMVEVKNQFLAQTLDGLGKVAMALQEEVADSKTSGRQSVS